MVYVVSGVSGEGVNDLLRAIAKEIVKRRAKKTMRQEAEWSP